MTDRFNKIDSSADVGKTLVDNLASNVTGIISVKPDAKYTSGARTVLKINNEIIGFAFSVAWNVNTTVSEIRTIDDYSPYELAPKHVTVNGNFGMLHIPSVGLSSELIQADFLNFLHQKYITIEVRDSKTDNLLFFTSRAMVTGRQESLQSEQLGRMNVTWQAIGWKDEREPTLPKDPKESKQTKAAGGLGGALSSATPSISSPIG